MAVVPGFELMYQKGNYDAGQPNKSILSTLVNPPASAVAAETASKNRYKNKGTAAPASRDVLGNAAQNRDWIRDDADKKSIQR